MIQETYSHFKFVLKNKTILRLLLFGAISLLFLSTMIDVRPVIFFAIFCMANALFMTYDRYVDLPLDIELSTFSTVLMTLKYGLVWGMLAGAFSKIASIIYNRDFNKNSLFSISCYLVAAFIASLFHGLPIIFLGLLVTILVNIYSMMISKFVMFLSNYEILLFTASNFIFNFVLFIGFSEIVIRMML